LKNTVQEEVEVVEDNEHGMLVKWQGAQIRIHLSGSWSFEKKSGKAPEGSGEVVFEGGYNKRGD
jgi:hypothetical protein